MIAEDQEAGNINQSLFTFSRFLNAVAKHSASRQSAARSPSTESAEEFKTEIGKLKSIIRDSALTKVLCEFIGGRSACNLIACIAPDSEFISESLRTLQLVSKGVLIKKRCSVSAFVAPPVRPRNPRPVRHPQGKSFKQNGPQIVARASSSVVDLHDQRAQPCVARNASFAGSLRTGPARDALKKQNSDLQQQIDRLAAENRQLRELYSSPVVQAPVIVPKDIHKPSVSNEAAADPVRHRSEQSSQRSNSPKPVFHTFDDLVQEIENRTGPKDSFNGEAKQSPPLKPAVPVYTKPVGSPSGPPGRSSAPVAVFSSTPTSTSSYLRNSPYSHKSSPVVCSTSKYSVRDSPITSAIVPQQRNGAAKTGNAPKVAQRQMPFCPVGSSDNFMGKRDASFESSKYLKLNMPTAAQSRRSYVVERMRLGTKSLAKNLLR